MKPLKNSLNKGFYALLFFVMIASTGFSQNVVISPAGTPANPSAGLDVNFTSKGLLIPRVALQSTSDFSPMTSHEAGMLVYNTATVGDVKPGFYFNNGTSWVWGLPEATSAGDIQYWDGTTWVTLPIGTVGQVMKLDSLTGLPTWADNTTLASLVTKAVTTITSTSASCGGIVINDGGSPVTAFGVCWSMNPNPTTLDFLTTDGSGVGNFVSSITLLSPATVYYIRAYAITSAGTVYGNELTFTTP